MAVYVDKAKNKYGRMVMSHLLADTLPELHHMAGIIGVQQKWFQDTIIPHYDICQSKKKLAIQHGAVECDVRDLRSLLKFWRDKETTNETDTN